ncbi:hypothetical protein ACFY9C_36425 [Streptomyces filamentosus]|uniref:hypothetical protein n=1 Tax=Streptomyces filamentosus TaxID=67294 RepID=UPI0036E26B56
MSATSAGPYDWADENDFLSAPVPQQVPPMPVDPPAAVQPPRQPRQRRAAGPSRAAQTAEAVGAAAGGFVGAAAGSFVPPIHLTYAPGGAGAGGGGRGGGGAGAAAPGAGDRHQGDRMIYLVERIELRSDRDIVALCKAINRLGRELHLILGMRAEEVQGVLSTYKGKWYAFGASSRVRARLVAAHLRVGAEAAKALGVAALKCAHAFDRHFVAPEREAKQQRSGKAAPKKTFTIGED